MIQTTMATYPEAAVEATSCRIKLQDDLSSFIPKGEDSTKLQDAAATKPQDEASTPVSYGMDIRKPQELTQLPLTDIMYRIKSGTYAEAIENIRAQADTELGKQLKQRLPYFVMAILKGSRCESHVVANTGLVLDFDDVADPEGAAQNLMAEIPYIRYCFLSPRRGLKAVVVFSEPVVSAELYARLWQHVVWEIEQLTGMKADNTPDRCRACYVSYDPEMRENLKVVFTLNEVEATSCRLKPLDDVSGFKPQDEAATTNESASKLQDAAATLEKIAAEQEPNPQIIPNLSEYYVKQAIDHLKGCKISYPEWIRCGMALYNQFGAVKGYHYWAQFQDNPHYHDTAENLGKMWNSLGKYPSVGLGSLFHIAREQGFNSVIYTSQDRKLEDFPELKSIYGEPEDVKLETEKLPDFMRSFLQKADLVTDSSHGTKLTALIPALACNIGNRIGMRAAGQTVYCNFYAMIIGESSYTRKSTTINLAVNNIMKSHADALTELSPKDRNEQSIIIKNITHARMLDLLSLNPNRLILKNEMAGWLQEMNKSYNNGMMLDLTNLYDGQSQNIAKMEVDAWIDNPAFSILGATTPEAIFKELKNNSERNNGFLPRFIYCFIRSVDPEKLSYVTRDTSAEEAEISKLGEVVDVFRKLTGRHILVMDAETEQWRQEIYTAKFKQNLLNKLGDSATSYFTRIYDGYWYKFCILGFAMKHWQELKEADENCRLARFFANNKLDVQTAREAMYLCDYYYKNAMPVMASFNEGSRLQDEKALISLIREKVGGLAISHSRLLTASRMNARDFNSCMSSLVEKQAVVAMDVSIGYHNRNAKEYQMNPVLV